VQKAYFVESPNVALFDSVGQTNLNFSGQYLTHFNAQYAHSLNGKAGLYAGMHLGYQGWTNDKTHLQPVNDNSFTNSFGLNGGYIWYNNSGNRYLELSAGYGFQTNTNHVRDRWLSPNGFLSGPWLDQSTDAIYHQLIIQPSVLWNKKESYIGFCFKNEFMYIPHYDYDFNVALYDDYVGYWSNSFSDQVSFSNKFTIAQQLFFIYRNNRHSLKWGFHAGAAWHALYLRKYYSFYHVNNRLYDLVPESHPAMAAVVIGLDLGFQWKKK